MNGKYAITLAAGEEAVGFDRLSGTADRLATLRASPWPSCQVAYSVALGNAVWALQKPGTKAEGIRLTEDKRGVVVDGREFRRYHAA